MADLLVAAAVFIIPATLLLGLVLELFHTLVAHRRACEAVIRLVEHVRPGEHIDVPPRAQQ